MAKRAKRSVLPKQTFLRLISLPLRKAKKKKK